jgi:hypothetical protein
MRYTLGMLVLGILLFIASAVLGTLHLDRTTLRVDDLTIAVAATFISLGLLTLAYRLFGEEPALTVLRQLMVVQRIAKSMYDAGIDDVAVSRGRFDPKQIEADLFTSAEIFVASNNFELIKYLRFQQYLTRYLHRPRTVFKLLVRADATALPKITQFRTALPQPLRDRLLVRSVDYLTSGVYGGDQHIYVTLYVRGLTGDESPALLCRRRADDGSLYSVYKTQFDGLWSNAKHL